jgi:hypothetical protein
MPQKSRPQLGELEGVGKRRGVGNNGKGRLGRGGESEVVWRPLSFCGDNSFLLGMPAELEKFATPLSFSRSRNVDAFSRTGFVSRKLTGSCRKMRGHR